MAVQEYGVSRMATIKIQEGERVKRVLHIDIETRSDVDLAKAGVYPYSESPQFKILLFAYAFDDEPVAFANLASGEALPEAVVRALTDPAILKVAHNASFERVCLSRLVYGAASNRFLDPAQWWCTMVQRRHARAAIFPGRRRQVLGTGEQKDKAGWA
jgi:DNA polymerase